MRRALTRTGKCVHLVDHDVSTLCDHVATSIVSQASDKRPVDCPRCRSVARLHATIILFVLNGENGDWREIYKRALG